MGCARREARDENLGAERATMSGDGSEERVEEWALAHQALSKLRLKRAGLDAEEGAWRLRASRAATHVYFGFASFGEYIERLFGLSRRAAEEKLRVAEALEELPELADALRSGTLNWSVVRELCRVAVPETEREWLAVARGRPRARWNERPDPRGRRPGARESSCPRGRRRRARAGGRAALGGSRYCDGGDAAALGRRSCERLLSR